jgi:hypothetical protein
VSNKKIVFCGDSFANACRRIRLHPLQLRTPDRASSYIDIVANQLNKDYVCFGYGGQGLWHSAQKMFDHFKLHDINEVDTLVLVISNLMRFNSTQSKTFHLTSMDNSDKHSNALELYYTMLADYEFHKWVYTSTLNEISEKFKDKKIISFFSFSHEAAVIDNAPGMVYTTPLSSIAFAQFDGAGDHNKSVELFLKSESKSLMSNHLNRKNNQAMASLIMDSLNNYRIGKFDLDLSNFDIVDKNTFKHVSNLENFKQWNYR